MKHTLSHLYSAADLQLPALVTSSGTTDVISEKDLLA